MAKIKRINLALQGGGAHGAYTWGVLDRLLEQEDVEIAAISGTSAGALNGAALKAGLLRDGTGKDREGAKETLDWFWSQVGGVNDMRMAQWFASFAPPSDVIAKAMEQSPLFAWVDMASRTVSPYDYGPFYQNPLAPIVERFAYDKVCQHLGPDLFVSATNVRTGKVRVFKTAEITSNVLMASACLPTLFQAVEFEDPKTGQVEAFWDGGYTGNPALFPLFQQHLPGDVVVVNINPLHRTEVPKTATDIQNRINEIGFNSSLLRELRAVNFVKRLIKNGQLEPGSMRDVLVHMIADDEMMTELSVATKTLPSSLILVRLKEAGRRAADTFLANHKDDLNERSSISLTEMFA